MLLKKKAGESRLKKIGLQFYTGWSGPASLGRRHLRRLDIEGVSYVIIWRKSILEEAASTEDGNRPDMNSERGKKNSG